MTTGVLILKTMRAAKEKRMFRNYSFLMSLSYQYSQKQRLSNDQISVLNRIIKEL